jgi:Holliday junction DNA helicase RuvB
MRLFSAWRNKKKDAQLAHPYSRSKKSTSLFDNIVGFEDIKEIFDMAINAEKPVHVLLCGPPASAKSLFMTSLTRLDRSYYAVGTSSTKSGIFDYLFEDRPRYFVMDEIEKMNKRDQASLLNLMESGILSELKHNQKRSTQLKTWVFASANSIGNLLPPLLTRFTVINIKPYSQEEFIEIAVQILEREEGLDIGIATTIAGAVFNTLGDANIRECIRIARLAGNDVTRVKRIIDTMVKYGRQKE